MSDSFEMLVDEDVSLLDAPAVCNKVIAVFRDIQLIVGEPTPGMGIMWMQQLYARFCGNASRLSNWHSRPPLGFGNLSFQFWNWPPLDLPGWTLDIPELVRQITGHSIVISWGRI
jgi:hypothetical protein